MLNMFLKARNRKKKGFTIIEMVVVIAIIGVLTSVLVPNFTSTLNNAEKTAKAANLSSINKIAATAATSDGLGDMVEVYGAVVTNFGEETAAKSVKDAVYNSDTKTFTSMKKVDVADESAPDRNLYYPVSGENAEAVAECLRGYKFVTYKQGTNALANAIGKKTAKVDLKDLSNKYTEVYVVNGSIALYDDVSLPNAMFIFTDGASIELNGNIFNCFNISFIDTSADGTAPVTFKEYGGTLKCEYGVGAFNVGNFYKDGAINWTEAAVCAETTKITFYCGGFVDVGVADYSHMYLNVDDACAIVDGTIVMPPNSELTLDGNAKLVVNDGGTILPAQSQANADAFADVSIQLKSLTETTKVELSENSFVGITVAEDSKNVQIDGIASAAGQSKFTVTPLTAAVAANRITQNAQAMLTAGGNKDAALLLVEKAGNSMVNTAASLCGAGGALAGVQGTVASLVSTADASTISAAINSMKTSVVSTVLSKVSGAAGAAVASSVGTVTLTTANGAVGGKTVVASINSYSTCDTSWYVGHEDETTYTISTPQQLYGLSTLVYNGTTSFYGKTIKLANDISLAAYKPWLPIGNGQYGFRGTFDGDGHKVTDMNLSVNEAWVMMTMSTKGWNNVSSRIEKEGTAFGFQYGDKYSVGFIGVLENGGTLKNVTFSNCEVHFSYNWNSYAAVAVGAIRATGEDYSDNAGNVPAPGCDTGKYADSGYRWKGATIAEQQASRMYDGAGGQTEKKGNLQYTSSTNYADRAYDGWTTTISNVTVDSSCSVEASGRCGGVCAVVAGAYYPNKGYNEGNVATAAGYTSIFAGWGNVVISGCTNAGSVTHRPTSGAYEEGGGVLGYIQVVQNAEISVTNCSNSGAITAGAAAGIVGSINGSTAQFTISGCSNTGTIATVANNANGVKVHSSVVASSIYNTTTSTAGTLNGNEKLS